MQDSSISREHAIYPSSILSPINRSPPPTTLAPSLIHKGTHQPCIDIPLSKGRLEPGEGVKMNLILQGLLPPSVFVSSIEVPWHIVFYYEPALITANSRIRSDTRWKLYMYMHVHVWQSQVDTEVVHVYMEVVHVYACTCVAITGRKGTSFL